MMTLAQSLSLGMRRSGGYFVSTFLFGALFGMAASSAGLDQWQTMFMSVAVFSASAQFAALEFWQSPLPMGTIALSVFLVSTRNILLGMALTHHLDGYSLLRRITWLFLLTDPGVVTTLRVDSKVDRLGYLTGYGLSLMGSWMSSTWIGFYLAGVLAGAQPESLRFAGPLVMATMMVLFAKGTRASPLPWLVSGIAALLLFEAGTANYLILPLSVAVGVASTVFFRVARNG